MTTEYYYDVKEFGYNPTGEITGPTNWSGLPEGEKIQLCPKPELPCAANKNGDHMIVRGGGGQCLDANHESEKSQDPIAGETRKVKMRCQ